MIICDNTICVRCLACVTESEFGGVTFEQGRIIVDESRPEDWQNIFATCPVGAMKIVKPEHSDELNLTETSRVAPTVPPLLKRVATCPVGAIKIVTEVTCKSSAEARD